MVKLITLLKSVSCHSRSLKSCPFSFISLFLHFIPLYALSSRTEMAKGFHRAHQLLSTGCSFPKHVLGEEFQGQSGFDRSRYYDRLAMSSVGMEGAYEAGDPGNLHSQSGAIVFLLILH